MSSGLSALPKRDLERLSAYLDGEISDKEAARLEARLEREPELGRALQELRATKSLLRSLPEVRPARDFRLTPEMVGERRRAPAYPALRLAAVLATFAFVLVVGLDALGQLNAAMAPEAMRVMATAAPEAAFNEAAPAQAPAAEAPRVEAEAVPTAEPLGGAAERAEAPLAPEARALEQAADQVLPAGTPCPECTPKVGEAGVLREATAPAPATAPQEPRVQTTAISAETTPAATPMPQRLLGLRLLEAALGLLAFGLIAAWLILRRRRTWPG